MSKWPARDDSGTVLLFNRVSMFDDMCVGEPGLGFESGFAVQIFSGSFCNGPRYIMERKWLEKDNSKTSEIRIKLPINLSDSIIIAPGDIIYLKLIYAHTPTSTYLYYPDESYDSFSVTPRKPFQISQKIKLAAL